MRDVVGLTAVGLPVFARGTHPDPSGATLLPWETDIAVQCGGVLVRPGDWILADTDSVLVVPAELAPEVASRGEATNREDEFCQRLLDAGFPLDEAYPLPAGLWRTWPASGGRGTSPAWRKCAGGGSTLAGTPAPGSRGASGLECTMAQNFTHRGGRCLEHPHRGAWGRCSHCSQPFCESCLSAGPRAADGTRGWFCARCRGTLEAAERVRREARSWGGRVQRYRGRALLGRSGWPWWPSRPGPACSSPGACSSPAPGAPGAALPCPPGPPSPAAS